MLDGWTPYEIERLWELVPAGHSYARISFLIPGGHSEADVAAKAQELGLTVRGILTDSSAGPVVKPRVAPKRYLPPSNKGSRYVVPEGTLPIIKLPRQLMAEIYKIAACRERRLVCSLAVLYMLTRGSFWTATRRSAVEKYQPVGKRLNPYELEILANLMEEAAEVIQAAAKLIRFGKDDLPPGAEPGQTNTRQLGMELGNLQHMIQVSARAKLVTISDMIDGQRSKAERLRSYMLHESPT